MANFIAIPGRKVREIRERLCLTQSEMAVRLGLSLGGVQRIEGREVANLRTSTAKKLAALEAEPAVNLESLRA